MLYDSQRGILWRAFVWVSWCLLGMACSDQALPVEQVAEAQNNSVSRDKPDEAALRASVARAMQGDASEAYAAVDEGAARFSLSNRAHRLTATMDRAGLVVHAENAAASFSLRTSEYGCAGAMRDVGVREPVAERNRVTYARPEFAMDEWYLNGPLGLEQGFTIMEAPGCAGTKVIAMETLGDVAPALEDPDGDGRGERVRLVADDGRTPFVVRDLAVVDAAGKKLPAWMTVEAGGIAIHFEDAGATYPVEVDPVIVTVLGKWLPDDGGGNEQMGRSVAISSDGLTAIVGANDDFGGVAFMYERVGGSWTVKQTLRANDAASADNFGSAVAIDGDTAIVGAPTTNGVSFANGSAYVFVRSNGVWPATETAKLTASDGAGGDYFGTSVAISGDTALVGVYSDNDPIKGINVGSAYVFVKPAGGWVTTQIFKAKLTVSDGAQDDQFGIAVALSGDTAIIGANYDDDKGDSSGSAYVFVKPASGWVTTQIFKAKLTASDGAAGDFFGASVALSGDTAIVGAPGDDHTGLDSGSAYVFVKPAGGWVTTQTFNAKLTASDGAVSDSFGDSVAFSGDTAIVGAPGDDDMGDESGSAYVFVKPAGGWVTTSQYDKKLMNASGAAGDRMGTSVAIAGSSVLISAPNDDHASGIDSGTVLSFMGAGANWTQEPALTWSKWASNDRFGTSVAISEDGLTAIVGASQDDDKSTNSGSAYVFARSQGDPWPTTHTAKLTPGDGAADDYFGWSVAISGDTAIVGAPYDDDKGEDSGSAYVFVKPAGGWVATQIFNAKLTASEGAAGDYFGISVALSGDTAIVGAPYDDDKGQNSGSAYVFVKPVGGWVTTQTFNAKLTASDGEQGDLFGRSVALSGDTVIVGAPLDDDKGSSAGSAYVFVKPAGGWTTTQTFNAKLRASDGAADDNFGWSVALSGDTAIVGAYRDDDKGTDSGSVYVFVKPAGGWTTTQTFNAKLRTSDGAAGDFFGRSVALSGDIAIVGTYRDAGSAYVFVRDAGVWDLGTMLLAPDGAAGDLFGASVAMGDGMAIIGAPSDDDAIKGPQSGSAYAVVMPKRVGKTCAAAAECLSSLCVDGVCCNSVCPGACRACSAQRKGYGVDGECGNIAEGSDPDDDCAAETENTCQQDGVCDGNGACKLWAAGTSCGARKCVDNVSKAGLCNGFGTCTVELGGTDCGAYGCDPATGQCITGCTADADCTADAYCDLSTNQCKPKATLGTACTASAQCQSGHCIDDVCCNEACDGTCQACGADGLCGNVTAGTPDDACAVDPVKPCGNTGLCGDAGTCALAASGTVCAEPSCSSGMAQTSSCDGNGTCIATTTPCGDYACGPTSCNTQCTTNQDCTSGAYCDNGQCKPDTSLGKTCTANDDCSSGHCIDTGEGSKVCCESDCASDACLPNRCNAAGSCISKSLNCSPYQCANVTSCKTSCSGDADCLSGYECRGHECGVTTCDATKKCLEDETCDANTQTCIAANTPVSSCSCQVPGSRSEKRWQFASLAFVLLLLRRARSRAASSRRAS